MTVKQLLDRLENHYDFQCEGGPLRLCVEWQQLKVAALEAAPPLPDTRGLVWIRCSEKHPPPHAKYLVNRDGWHFVATPCYGMHHPWWVAATAGESNQREADPVPIRDGDEWVAIAALAPRGGEE